MTEEKVIKLISELKSLSPRAGFAAQSKEAILVSSRRASPALAPKRILSRVLDMGLSLALMSALVIAILSGVGLMIGRNPAGQQPPVLNENLTSQANAAIKDINVHLSDVEYFKNETTKTSAALTVAAGREPAVAATSSQSQAINNALNQAAQ